MKKEYKVLLYIIVINYAIVYVLNLAEIKIVSLIPRVLGMLFFMGPIEILFWLLGRDEAQKPRVRIVFKFLFWFILVSFCGGFVAEVLEVFYGQF